MPLASDPCQAGHVGEGAFTGDLGAPADVAAWRQVERLRLRAERRLLTPAMAARNTARIVDHLEPILRSIGTTGLVIGASWPIRGEPNLMPFLATLRGVTLSLAVCTDPPQAMRYRRWAPDATMQRGLWNLPVPLPSAGEVTPDLLLVPLLGWDDACHRLGFGTGYFDRTLAALRPAPFVIGIGLHAARLSTIHPQPHDRACSLILTECGVEPPIPDPAHGCADGSTDAASAPLPSAPAAD